MGWSHLELAQVPTRVALALHMAGRSTPSGVTPAALALLLVSSHHLLSLRHALVKEHTLSRTPLLELVGPEAFGITAFTS